MQASKESFLSSSCTKFYGPMKSTGRKWFSRQASTTSQVFSLRAGIIGRYSILIGTLGPSRYPFLRLKAPSLAPSTREAHESLLRGNPAQCVPVKLTKCFSIQGVLKCVYYSMVVVSLITLKKSNRNYRIGP